MVTLYDIQKLQDEISQYKATLQEIRDLARTGMPPQAFDMTLSDWNTHKINKIAYLANKALKEIKND